MYNNLSQIKNIVAEYDISPMLYENNPLIIFHQRSCFCRAKLIVPLGGEWTLLLLNSNNTLPLGGRFTTPPLQCWRLNAHILPPDLGFGLGHNQMNIPCGRERVGHEESVFCACYQSGTDCTQPPLPVSLPGNQWLHFITTDLDMHTLSIETILEIKQILLD